jgi:predicted KAP-like P-loop ATPase
MNNIVGVIDEPVSRGSSDNLDINVHSNSLIKFIHQTSSPITIGIQGEWGSGKTSLINTIHYAFEQDQIFKQIWINAWE